jgi:hypothetical protein
VQGGEKMLEGKDFVILTADEVALIYRALEVSNIKTKAEYKELQKLGILSIVQRMKQFLKDTNFI